MRGGRWEPGGGTGRDGRDREGWGKVATGEPRGLRESGVGGGGPPWAVGGCPSFGGVPVGCECLSFGGGGPHRLWVLRFGGDPCGCPSFGAGPCGCLGLGGSP